MALNKKVNKSIHPRNQPTSTLVIPPIPTDEYHYEIFGFEYEGKENEEMKSGEFSLSCYDKNLGKYMGGLQLKLTPHNNMMKIADVDKEGFLYLTPCDDKCVKQLTCVMTFGYGKGVNMTEDRLKLQYDQLVTGEVVVANIRAAQYGPRFIRGQIEELDKTIRNATVRNTETNKTYVVPQNNLFPVSQSIMAIPFQLIKCRLKGLEFFHETKMVGKLVNACYMNNQILRAQDIMECSFEFDTSDGIPVVQVQRLADSPGKFACETYLKYLPRIVGARLHLCDKSKSAAIIQMDVEANFWLRYDADLFLKDKLDAMFLEAEGTYDSFVLKTPLSMEHLTVGRLYMGKVCTGNLRRVIVKSIFAHRNCKCCKKLDVASSNDPNTLVECVDTGLQLKTFADELVPINKFAPLMRRIPALAIKVRHMEIDQLPPEVVARNEDFQTKRFNARLIEWASEYTLPVIKLTVITKEGEIGESFKQFVGIVD